MRIMYRWKHHPTGTTGTRARVFLSRQSFLDCLDFWNACSPDWTYEETSTAERSAHEEENDSVYSGPFEFYENPLAK